MTQQDHIRRLLDSAFVRTEPTPKKRFNSQYGKQTGTRPLSGNPFRRHSIARRAEVLSMVLSQAGKLVIAGVALGLVAALLASRLLQSQLFEITPTDATTYLAVAAGLILVSMVASWIPARRASRIDPMTALRQD